MTCRTLRGRLVDTAGTEPGPDCECLSTLVGTPTMVSPDPSSSGRPDRPCRRNDFTARHAPGRPLIDAAEGAVRQCDEVADRLRREADRIATWHTLQQKLELHETAGARSVDEQAAAKDALP